MNSWIVQLILGLLNTGLGITNTVLDKQNADAVNAANLSMNEENNATNYAISQETNAANERNVAATNAANAQQAELAYQRSLPSAQVRDLMNAGLSRSGALAKLAGGGTYTAPAMQAAQVQGANMQAGRLEKHSLNMQGISEILERMGNIPANYQQAELVDTQLQRAKQDLDNARAEERRKQQQHDIEMDERLYNKWERESMNEFMSLMESTAQDKNLQPQPEQSMHDYVRALGLQDNELYRKLPASARQRAFDHYKQAMDEKRAQQEATDKHVISTLQAKQLRNLSADFDAAKNAREREYAARAIAAELEILRSKFDITHQEYENSIRIMTDEHGNIVPSRYGQMSAQVREFWETVSDLIPISTLSKALLKGLK